MRLVSISWAYWWQQNEPSDLMRVHSLEESICMTTHCMWNKSKLNLQMGLGLEQAIVNCYYIYFDAVLCHNHNFKALRSKKQRLKS